MAHHGCYIPENGVDGLYTMLCTAITEAGGRICAEIEQIEGFVVEEVPTDSTQASQNMPQTYHGSDNSRETKRTRLLGVMVRDNSKVMIVKPRLSVVSGLGVISTYRNVMLATIKPSPGNGDQEISFAHVVPTEVEKVWRGVEEAAATVLCVFAVSKRCLDTADGSILAAMSCAHFKSSLFDETIKYDATGNLLHVQADLKNGLVVDGRYKVWSPSLSDRYCMPMFPEQL